MIYFVALLALVCGYLLGRRPPPPPPVALRSAPLLPPPQCDDYSADYDHRLAFMQSTPRCFQ